MKGIRIDLSDQVVIVVGAGGGGIGTAITRSVVEAGGTVVAADISADSLEKYISPMLSEGLAVIPLVADVREADGVEAVMRAARQAAGRLRGLVTVVGGAHAPDWKSSLDVSRADWGAMLSWNLSSMFFMTQAVAAELRGRGDIGSIVAVSSISGLGAAPFHVGYGAAKAAILSIVRTLALELAGSGIRINALAPGAVGTPGSLVSPPDDQLRSAIPLGRVARAEEVAAGALFLLSDLASYVTGQCLTMDGGTSIRWAHLDADNTPKLVDDDAFRRRLVG